MSSKIGVWNCPLCPMIYRRTNHFERHLSSSHNLDPSGVSPAWKTDIPEEEYDEMLIKATEELKNEEAERYPKPARSDWGKNAFSSQFPCDFCPEVFKKVHNYLLHLKIRHKSEPREALEAATAEAEHYTLDGCEYRCELCRAKFHQSSSFMRHTVKHGMTFKQYVGRYGSPEISSSQFRCRLCSRSMKRTRNIVTVHVKTVHGLSWQDYRNNTKAGSQTPADGPVESQVEMFKCKLCKSEIKGKKQHLNRVHKIDLEAYETYVTKLESGEQVPKLESCKICSRVCLELEKHVRLCHRIEMDEYNVQETETEECSDVNSLSCVFNNCGESFSKGNDLIIHINIVHANEDEELKEKAKSEVLREMKAKQISEKLGCKMCGGSYSSRSSLWVHVTRKHGLPWKEYEEKFGSVEMDISRLKPFQCRICNEKVNNEMQKVKRHIQTHNLSHSEYVQQYVKNNNSDTDSDDGEPTSEEEEEPTIIKKEAEEESNIPPVVETPSLSSLKVTDRSLKSCARCSLDFPSRLRFIRHCHLVHKMRFRLKNGDRLVLH